MNDGQLEKESRDPFIYWNGDEVEIILPLLPSKDVLQVPIGNRVEMTPHTAHQTRATTRAVGKS